MEKIKIFISEERGTQVVENGLVITLIAVAAVAGMSAVGQQVLELYTSLTNKWP